MTEPSSPEWSRPLTVRALDGLELAHARFASHVFPLHAHAEYVVGAVVQGAKKSRIGRRWEVAEKGYLTLFNPFEEHESAGVTESWTFTGFYPTPALVNKWFAQESAAGAVRLSGNVIADLAGARRIGDLYRFLSRRHSVLTAEIAFVETMSYFIVEHAGPSLGDSAVQAGVQRAFDRLSTDLASEAGLADLAQTAGLSPATLLRAFRRSFGCTPRVFLTARKLATAKQLLGGGTSAVDVAHDLGFCDQSHFIRVFHRWTGSTPSAFAAAERGEAPSARRGDKRIDT